MQPSPEPLISNGCWLGGSKPALPLYHSALRAIKTLTTHDATQTSPSWSHHVLLRTELGDALLPSFLRPWMLCRTFLELLGTFLSAWTHRLRDTLSHGPWHQVTQEKSGLSSYITGNGVLICQNESLAHLPCWVFLYSWWFGSPARCLFWLYQKNSALNLNDRWSHVLLPLRKAILTIWKHS